MHRPTFPKQTSGRTIFGAPRCIYGDMFFYFSLKQEELRAAIEAESLDGAGHHFLAAGKAHGRDGLDFAEVDDEAVGIGRTRAVPTGVPHGFGIAVEHKFGITHHGFLCAGINYLPAVGIHGIALAIEELDFREAGTLSVIRRQHLDAEVAQRGGRGKAELLEAGLLLHLA